MRNLANFSTIILLVLTTYSQGLSATSLPYHEEAYNSEGSSTIVSPLIQLPAKFQSLSSISTALRSIPGDISELGARNFLLQDTAVSISKSLDSAQVQTGYVEADEIYKEGSAWLKIRFKPFDLGEARLSIISQTSGQVQSFTGSQLENWSWSSPMLMGDRVRVQLTVPSGTRMPSIKSLMDKVIVGESAIPIVVPETNEGPSPKQKASDDKERICGNDDRRPSMETRVGRMVPTGCTVFIIDGGVYATAGHCIDDSLSIQEVQFNVPLSTSAGAIRAPEARDQYPILVGTMKCSGCFGNDLPHGEEWAVFKLGQNNETGMTPIEAQGKSFKITGDYLAHGRPISEIRIDGYGYSGKPPAANYTNQYSTGKFVGLASGSNSNHAELHHFADTEQGNSGSPIVMMAPDGTLTDTAIGIHTGGRCNPPSDMANKGTGFSNIALKQAIEALSQER